MPGGAVDASDQMEFSDADFRIVAKADQSKKAKAELSGSATNTTAIFVLEGQQITTVASGTTTNIGAANTREVSISGTTTITAFDTVQAGIYREGVFTGALTLTHNATSLILPGAANITTAAGDTFGAVSLGSGNWRVLWYTKASGASIVASGASLLGTVNTTSGSSQSLSSLTLTSYKFLVVALSGVSSGATNSYTISFNGIVIYTATLAADAISGNILVTLGNGAFSSVVATATGTNNKAEAGPSGLSTASTSVTLTTSGTFDAGSFSVYGLP